MITRIKRQKYSRFIILFFAALIVGLSIGITSAQNTIVISPNSPLPVGQVNRNYDQTITAANGTAPYRFSITSGTLPDGLSLSQLGRLRGTPLVYAANKNFTFTVRVIDRRGLTNDKTYTLSIVDEICFTPLCVPSVITLPNGKVGDDYSAPIIAHGGTQPYTYKTSSILPDGLSFRSSGSLSGKPTEDGRFLIVVTATDANGFTANQGYRLSILARGLTLSMEPDTGFVEGTVGSLILPRIKFIADGGRRPYTFSNTGLPPGLSLVQVGANYILAGVPTKTGQWLLTVTVKDLLGTTVDIPWITITISSNLPSTPTPPPPPPPPTDSDHDGVADNAPDQCPNTPAGNPVDTTGCIPLKLGDLSSTTATACKQYEGTISASDGKQPYTFSGSLPNGWLVSPDGKISGKPLNVGVLSLSLKVTDVRGVPDTGTRTLQVNAPTIKLDPTSGALANGKVGVAYSQQIDASGSSAPYSFKVTADVLPDGLSLGTNGLISGTPSRSGGGKTFNFTITVTDPCGFTASAQYSIMIEAPPPDGDGDGVFDSTPDLCPNTPAGSSVDARGCIPLNLGDLQPAQATACQPYNGNITASDGIPGYTFSGTAPRGLQLMANGSISGVPLDAGGNPFQVTVTDTQPISTSGTYTLQVIAPTIQLSPSGALPNGRIGYDPYGTTYSQQLTASGSTGSYSFAVTARVLPDGLSLYGYGLIAGIPTSRNHTDGFTITAMDACGYKGSAQYTIAIEQRLGENYSYDALGSSDPFVYGRVCTDYWTLTYLNQTLVSSECVSSCRTPDVFLPPFEPVWQGSCISRPGQ